MEFTAKNSIFNIDAIEKATGKIVFTAVKNGYRTIPNHAGFICECGYSIGIPRRHLTDKVQAYNIECPICHRKFVGYASLKSCD